MSGILVVLEQRARKIARINLGSPRRRRSVSAAPASITAVVLGADTESAAAEIAARAPGKVIRVEHPLLAPYTADGFIAVPSPTHPKSRIPTHVVFPHTYQVRDFAPALAARFGQVLISDVIAISRQKPAPIFTRQLMQGRLNGNYRHTASGPCFVSVQAGAFPADTAPDATPAAHLHLHARHRRRPNPHPPQRALPRRRASRRSLLRANASSA